MTIDRTKLFSIMSGVCRDPSLQVCLSKQDTILRILTHCTLVSCIRLASVNKQAHLLSSEDGFFSVMCGRLMHDFKLYAPSKISRQTLWKDVFYDIYSFRNKFSNIEKFSEDELKTSPRSRLKKTGSNVFQVLRRSLQRLYRYCEKFQVVYATSLFTSPVDLLILN